MWLKVHDRLFNLTVIPIIQIEYNLEGISLVINDSWGEIFVLKKTSNPGVVLRNIENQLITGAPFLDISDHVVRPE